MPTTAAKSALGVSGFMKAALGVRFLGASVFLAVGFFAVGFFAVAIMLLSYFLQGLKGARRPNGLRACNTTREL